MEVRELSLPGVFEIIPKTFGDDRGFFSETFSQSRFAALGLPDNWVQDNHSFSAPMHVLRGLHFQTPPAAQDKLVRVVRGAILDVAVDIRKGSPHFGAWVSLEVSAKRWNQILVPKGFAHGFMTLEPDTEVIYKVTAPYSPADDRGIRWDDPEIGINWPLGGNEPVLSAKDKIAPLLRDTPTGFEYSEKFA
jgi:dTDP-4-dehydrorhamnose 3,5-epimerase